MTNEEAIKIFKEVREEVIAKETELSRQVFENIGIKAIDLAIKVLEQQPCEDCISRTELLARIDAERKHLLDIKMDGAEHIIVHHARRIIVDMPSITPTISDVENNYNIGYNCGYADAMFDISEGSDSE